MDHLNVSDVFKNGDLDLQVQICHGLRPPTAPFNLIYHCECDILWSVTPADVYNLTSGSTLPSPLTLLCLYATKRCGSLI